MLEYEAGVFDQAPPIPPRHRKHTYRKPKPKRPTIVIPKSKYSPLSARLHTTPPSIDQHPAFRTPVLQPTQYDPTSQGGSANGKVHAAVDTTLAAEKTKAFSPSSSFYLGDDPTKDEPSPRFPSPRLRFLDNGWSAKEVKLLPMDYTTPSSSNSTDDGSRSNSSPASSTRSSQTSNSTYGTSYLPSPIPKYTTIAPQEITYIWAHASLLHSVVHYNETLRTFQHLQQRAGIPHYLQARLWLNIGLLHSRIKEHYFASEAFLAAVKAAQEGALEQAMGVFLMGCAQFDAAWPRKAAECFDMCESFFGADQEDRGRVRKAQAEILDMRGIGLDYTLRRTTVRSNRNTSLEAAAVADRVKMKSEVQWNLHRIPTELIVEAPMEGGAKSLVGSKVDEAHPPQNAPPTSNMTELFSKMADEDVQNLEKAQPQLNKSKTTPAAPSEDIGKQEQEQTFVEPTIVPTEIDELSNLLMGAQLSSSPADLTPYQTNSVYVEDLRINLKPSKSDAPSLYTSTNEPTPKSTPDPNLSDSTRPSTPDMTLSDSTESVDDVPAPMSPLSAGRHLPQHHNPPQTIPKPASAPPPPPGVQSPSAEEAAESYRAIISGSPSRPPTFLLFPPTSTIHARNISAPEYSTYSTATISAETPPTLSTDKFDAAAKPRKRFTDEPQAISATRNPRLAALHRRSSLDDTTTTTTTQRRESSVIVAAAADGDAARAALASAKSNPELRPRPHPAPSPAQPPSRSPRQPHHSKPKTSPTTTIHKAGKPKTHGPARKPSTSDKEARSRAKAKTKAKAKAKAAATMTTSAGDMTAAQKAQFLERMRIRLGDLRLNKPLPPLPMRDSLRVLSGLWERQAREEDEGLERTGSVEKMSARLGIRDGVEGGGLSSAAAAAAAAGSGAKETSEKGSERVRSPTGTMGSAGSASIGSVSQGGKGSGLRNQPWG